LIAMKIEWWDYLALGITESVLLCLLFFFCVRITMYPIRGRFPTMSIIAVVWMCIDILQILMGGFEWVRDLDILKEESNLVLIDTYSPVWILYLVSLAGTNSTIRNWQTLANSCPGVEVISITTHSHRVPSAVFAGLGTRTSWPDCKHLSGMEM
jgi:hypothetical protein